MTETSMSPIELLQKHDEGDFLRAVAEAVLQTLMEYDAEVLIGAGRYERGDGCQTWRNGYRNRELKTPRNAEPAHSQAATGLLLPRLSGAAPDLREGLGGGDPGGLDRWRLDPPRGRPRASDGAQRHLEEHGVEARAKDIDERGRDFLDRPLAGDWPYLWLDATYLKVRQGGRILSVAAIVAVAANTNGRREIIGLTIGPSEAETFWTELPRAA